MTIYSHSRLSTFEQCPLKFKYRYIDKIATVEKSIESHLGKTVHNTLEWMYLQIKQNKIPSVDDIITYYTKDWEKTYDNNIKIIKKDITIKDYFNKGVKFLLDYYLKHKPFDDNTLEVEKRIQINLDKEGKYKVQGFIDRLVFNTKTKEYEIHDYKTGNGHPLQRDMDKDRQLALYSMGIKDLFGKDKNICLVWHYLAHNIKICSRRTNEQLEQLKKETIELINKIESTEKFNPYISKLCDWCEYKNTCPAWDKKPPKHQKQLKEFEKKVDELDIWN